MINKCMSKILTGEVYFSSLLSSGNIMVMSVYNLKKKKKQ